jgi:hypothetical protein
MYVFSLNKYIYILCVLYTVIAATSCSHVSLQTSKHKPDNLQQTNLKPEIRSDTIQDRTKEPPLDLQITQSFVQASKLHVKVLVNAKTDFPADEVIVSLFGLRDGEIVEKQTKLMSEEINSRELSNGQSVVLYFVLNKTDLSEYQVKCSWGKDALEIIASIKAGSIEPTTNVNVFLDEIEIVEQTVSCNIAPCDIFYTLFGTINNQSDNRIPEIDLAIGLFWVNEGQTLPSIEAHTKLAPNEEVISLSNINLAPGESRKVRVTVDRGVPILPGGKFIPRLRILDHSKL